MTHLQTYLRAGGDIEALKTTHGVKTRRHTKFPNLVLFKYEQIGAVFTEPLTHECRGIILDEADDWRIVGRAFDKFFNHGEFYASEIDWTTARVQEKLDGSLCTLYEYGGTWHVATSGTPDAIGDVHSTGQTFADYFWRTFADAGGRVPAASIDGDYCFSFELMGPANRIVVVHPAPWIRLLATRNRRTGEQYDPEVTKDLVNIPAVKSFPLTSHADIEASFLTMSPLSQEGYVVVDGSFNRVKVKHPGYVALHHAKDGLGPKAFVEIVRAGEVSEVLNAFPEFAPLIEETRRKYNALVGAVNDTFAEIRDIAVQKEFAIEACKTPYSAALFQMRKGKDLGTLFREVAVEKLMDWMEVAA